MTQDQKLIASINKELKSNADADYKAAQHWFFKEEIELIGVRVGTVRKIARNSFKQITPINKKHILDLCEKLLTTNLSEHSIIAYQWTRMIADELTPKDFNRLEKWLKKYVNTWAKCDDFCTGVVGPFLNKHPTLINKTIPWRQSRNRWVRRGAAVSLIIPVKKGGKLKPIFSAANHLLTDTDDMVQKGYGWMLKEASNVFPDEVFQYVMKNKKKMPRTALRYAIEKLPKTSKQKAMVKD
jgi:3-methyladenine DNA glycosylase AlkD